MTTERTSSGPSPRASASARSEAILRAVWARPGSPATWVIRRWPSSYRWSRTWAMARASSAHTEDRGPVSPVPPIMTAGRPSCARSSGRGSSVRGSTTRTPSTRRSAHQRRWTAHSASMSSTTWKSRATRPADSTSCMPETSWRKKDSTPRVCAGRASTSPTAPERSPDRARAALLGCQPSSSATPRIRARVSRDTPGRSLSAKDTALSDTPARRAMSLMVGLRAMACLPLPRPWGTSGVQHARTAMAGPYAILPGQAALSSIRG